MFTNNQQSYIARINSNLTKFSIIKKVGIYFFNYITAIQYYPSKSSLQESSVFFASLGNGDWNDDTTQSWINIGYLNLSQLKDDLNLSRLFFKANNPATKDLAVQQIEYKDEGGQQILYGCLGNLNIKKKNRNQIGFFYYGIKEKSIGSFYLEYSQDSSEKLSCIALIDKSPQPQIVIYYEYQKDLFTQAIFTVYINTTLDLMNKDGFQSSISLKLTKGRFENEPVQMKINQYYFRNYESKTIQFFGGKIYDSLGKSAGFIMDQQSTLSIHYRTYVFDTYYPLTSFSFTNLISSDLEVPVNIEDDTSQKLIQVSAIKQDKNIINSLTYWPNNYPKLLIPKLTQTAFVNKDTIVTCVIGEPCKKQIAQYKINDCKPTEKSIMTQLQCIRIANVLRCDQSVSFVLKFISICENTFQILSYHIPQSVKIGFRDSLFLRDDWITYSGQQCKFLAQKTEILKSPDFVVYDQEFKGFQINPGNISGTYQVESKYSLIGEYITFLNKILTPWYKGQRRFQILL
eukprot:403340327